MKASIVIKPKHDDWAMRLVGAILRPFDGGAFMTQFWTTYRLPFMSTVRICYPKDTDFLENRQRHAPVIAHEMHHVEQFNPWYGPWLVIAAQVLPLPVLFSGRWFVERHAYLDDIKSGRYTIEAAVNTLWSGYGCPWPRPWMRRWFEKQMGWKT